eukprot:13667-Heterococcus_DN1.PRE.3
MCVHAVNSSSSSSISSSSSVVMVTIGWCYHIYAHAVREQSAAVYTRMRAAGMYCAAALLSVAMLLIAQVFVIGASSM